eukprot:5190568-Pleurochrysis_carterae.AAC.1
MELAATGSVDFLLETPTRLGICLSHSNDISVSPRGNDISVSPCRNDIRVSPCGNDISVSPRGNQRLLTL